MKKILITTICALALMLLLVLPASAVDTCNLNVTYMCGGQSVGTGTFAATPISADGKSTVTCNVPEGYLIVNDSRFTDDNLQSVVFNGSGWTEMTVSYVDATAAAGKTYDIAVCVSATEAKMASLATPYTSPVDKTVEIEDLMVVRNVYTGASSPVAAYKMTLEADDVIFVSIAGIDGDEPDCLVRVLEPGGGSWDADNDNAADCGEAVTYHAPVAGEYVFFLMGYSSTETGTCRLQLRPGNEMIFHNDTPSYTGNGFEWDLDNKTLTLFDGSDITADSGVQFFTDATVVVKGEAKLTSPSFGIYVDYGFSIAIKGEGSNAALTIDSQNGGIMVTLLEGEDLTVEISDLKLNITSTGFGILGYGGLVSLTNCDTVIDTSTDGYGILASEIVVTGGKLNVTSLLDSLNAESKIAITDAELELCALSNPDQNNFSFPIAINDNTGVSISDEFTLYDVEGNVMYKGEWKNSLLVEWVDTASSSGDVPVFFEDEGDVKTYVIGISDGKGGTTYATRVLSTVTTPAPAPEEKPIPATADMGMLVMLGVGISGVSLATVMMLKRKVK